MDGWTPWLGIFTCVPQTTCLQKKKKASTLLFIHSLAPQDERIRFWLAGVKGQGHYDLLN